MQSTASAMSFLFFPNPLLLKPPPALLTEEGRQRRSRVRVRCSPISTVPPCRIVRSPQLDRHAARASRTRFARRLLSLLLSKPRRFLPLRVLRRCRSRLSLHPSRPLLPFLLRYPSLFRFHDAFPSPCLAVRLTPQAEAFAARIAALRLRNTPTLVAKLQRLLMLAPSRCILLSKLAHVAPDLGLPPDFRSSFCPRHPDHFLVVQTCHGPALSLSNWDPSLALLTPPPTRKRDRIMDRPLRFPHIPLRRGLNLRRKHLNYLLHVGALPDVSPFDAPIAGASVEMEEKRACAVVREVLGMTTEKRTLIDHLTHFRKDFGLPNRLYAMLVRHPELFYVSIKGVRHSVFLVEAYDDDGNLLVEDELLAERAGLEALVLESKRIRRQLKREGLLSDDDESDNVVAGVAEQEEENVMKDEFDELFDAVIGEDWEEFQDEDGEDNGYEVEEFWVQKAVAAGLIDTIGEGELEAW